MDNDGGQAFPSPSEGYDGMSLRDWFAGQALIGMALSMNAPERRRYREDCADGREAKVAYALADAMLKAREAE